VKTYGDVEHPEEIAEVPAKKVGRREAGGAEDPRLMADKLLLDAFRTMDEDSSGNLSLDELFAGLLRFNLPFDKVEIVIKAVVKTDEEGIDFETWREIVECAPSGSDDPNRQAQAVISHLKGAVLLMQSSRHPVTVEQKPPEDNRFMLHPNGYKRAFWDAMLMSLCIYLAISLPYFLGFEDFLPVGVVEFFDLFHLSIDGFFPCRRLFELPNRNSDIGRDRDDGA
jgi:hypothetical protein